MHEEALLRDLRRKVDALSAEHGGATIVRARVAVGRLSHLEPAHLREHWVRAMAGGPAAEAVLDVETIPGLDDPHATAVVLRSITFAEPPTPGSFAPDG